MSDQRLIRRLMKEACMEDYPVSAKMLAALVAKECAKVYEHHLADARVGAQLINARIELVAKFGEGPCDTTSTTLTR